MNVNLVNLSPFTLPFASADDAPAFATTTVPSGVVNLNNAAIHKVSIGDNPLLRAFLEEIRSRLPGILNPLLDAWHKENEAHITGTPAGCVHITVENLGPNNVVVRSPEKPAGVTVLVGETYLAISPGYVEIEEV